MNALYTEELVQVLGGGGVAVIPTDTIYGIVALASDVGAVERIFTLKKRSPNKPVIILCASADDLERFNVSKQLRDAAEEYWPGPVSIKLDSREEKFEHLQRTTDTLAFRVPGIKDLRELLEKTGPLVAPSANHEGHPPARSMSEARAYFGKSVECYIDGGIATNDLPSTVIKLSRSGIVSLVRQGAVRVDQKTGKVVE